MKAAAGDGATLEVEPCIPIPRSDSVPTVSVVVPVYQGELTLEPLVKEILDWSANSRTPSGRGFRLSEIILVHDGAIDNSHRTIEILASRCPIIKPVWLSRNYGQHAALIAGMARSTGDWIATLDEDGQHDPADVGNLLDRAVDTGAQLVYARPTNAPPHGKFRNLCSRLTKWISGSILSSNRLGWFHSFRLIEGDLGRQLSNLCATHIYLDVAMSWVVFKTESCPLAMRREFGRPSGHNFRSLLTHFWRLVLASSTRPLRLIAALGGISLIISLGVVAYALWSKWVWKVPVPGWASIMIVMCFFGGILLFSQAVIAEYLGIAVTMAMGKPLYLTVSRPCQRETPTNQRAN